MGELFGIGVSSGKFWILMNAEIGIDFEWDPNTVARGRLGDLGLAIDMESLILQITCQNAIIRASLTSVGLIDLQIDIYDRCESSLSDMDSV